MKAHGRNVNARGRLMAVAAVLVLAMAGLVARTAWLQLLHTDFYQRQGDARFLRDIPIPASRGAILDRNDEPLAMSTPVASIRSEERRVGKRCVRKLRSRGWALPTKKKKTK